MLEINNAVCGYRARKAERVVIDGISMTVDRGQVLCVLGANGVGKTTLFRSILGGLPLLGGTVTADGDDLSLLTPKQRATRIAYVPQAHTPTFSYTVLQAVVMGRTAHLTTFSTPSDDDYAKAFSALEMMGIEQLAQTPYTQISGGERQLVLIARAIAQETDYLIMDEPAANLDFGNRIRVLRRVRELEEAGKGIIMTTHDPDHAFAVASQVVLIRGKNDHTVGKTEDILTEEVLSKLYGIEIGLTEAVRNDGRRAKTAVGFL